MLNLTLWVSITTLIFTGLTLEFIPDESAILTDDKRQIQHRRSNNNQRFRHSPPHLTTNFSVADSGKLTSISSLLQFPRRYHQKMVTVQGTIAQPEMHLDETELFFKFVFLLTEGEHSIVVFGQHDRTQGGSAIAMGNTVQVSGIFWKDRIADDYHFENNLEAITVSPYPSLTPNRT